MPKTLTPGPTSRAPKKPAHTHRFSVESDEAEVTVQIGADAAGQVPGGFAKFFNRVVDSGAWGRLSNAGRGGLPGRWCGSPTPGRASACGSARRR